MLIGVAVVIGIVLLQVVDNGAPVGGGTTSGTQPHSGTTTTGSGARTPQDVHVVVLNGSGVSGAASTLTNKLRGLGYNTGIPGNAPIQTGTTITCKAGFEKELAVLAGPDIVGTATTIPFPNPAPAEAANMDCIIIVGK